MDLGSELRSLGLSGPETAVYLGLIEKGPQGARALADSCGLARPSVYAALRSLSDKGLVESGAGYGQSFRAAPPEEAFPMLIERERDDLIAREIKAKELARQLAEISAPEDAPGDEVVEVLRNPRVITERFTRLLKGVEHSLDTFVKGPGVTSTEANHHAVMRALERGVRIRGLYEEALDTAGFAHYLHAWMRSGYEARRTGEVLPFKLVLFDSDTALMVLDTLDGTRPLTSMLIRHPDAVSGFRSLFEFAWGRGEPMDADDDVR